jgi:hypothetical protein
VDIEYHNMTYALTPIKKIKPNVAGMVLLQIYMRKLFPLKAVCLVEKEQIPIA